MALRQSDKELIRIIAMFFIVMWHIFLHGGSGDDLPGADFIRGITLTGVNLFVLISGWFGICLNWRSLLNLYTTVFFYMMVSLLVVHFAFNYQIVSANVIDLFFPMSRKSGLYWFVSCYFMLMLFSPAINFFLKRSSTKQYLLLLFILCYLSCFSGFLFNNSINMNGYNTFHFVFMYVLGNGLRRLDIPAKLKRKYWLGIYTMSTVFVLVLLHFTLSKGIRYNNPFLILAAVCLFCYISSFKFESNGVNYIAKFMFPVYLVQEGYCGLYAYKWLHDCSLGIELKYLGSIVVYLIGLLLITIVVESTRHKFISPLIDSVAARISARFDIF